MKRIVVAWVLCAVFVLHANGQTPPSAPDIRFEEIHLTDGGPPATLQLLYKPGAAAKHPVILTPGAFRPGEVPYWGQGLVDDGFMLCAFGVAHPPDPDPSRRPVWLFFDQRFAHGYTLGGLRAPDDAKRIIDHLSTRPDVHPEKFGWMGSSSSGIPSLAAATKEKRLQAIVAFVSTGAYRRWFETWHTNGLWKGTTPELWPETDAILKEHDPILHVDRLFPTAILMVSGGADKVVDPQTTREFADAARPFYAKDPARLRFVVYEGFGHNLPRDVVTMYTEAWFRLYLHPVNPPPAPDGGPANLDESVKRTQINAKDHKDLINGK